MEIKVNAHTTTGYMLTMNGSREGVQTVFSELAALTVDPDGPHAPLSTVGAISIPPAWVEDFQNFFREYTAVPPVDPAEPPFDPGRTWRSRTELLRVWVTVEYQPCACLSNRADTRMIGEMADAIINNVNANSYNPLYYETITITQHIEKHWQTGLAVDMGSLLECALVHPVRALSRRAGLAMLGARLREDGMTVEGVFLCAFIYLCCQCTGRQSSRAAVDRLCMCTYTCVYVYVCV